MTPNELYREIYQAEEYNAEILSLRERKRSAQDAFTATLESEFRRLHPRHKHVDLSRLPAEFLAVARARVLSEYGLSDLESKEQALRDEHDRRSELLGLLAPYVQITPSEALEVVAVESDCRFRSQTQSESYLRWSFYRYVQPLHEAGVRTSYDRTEHTLDLLANCPRWQADAAARAFPLDREISGLKSQGCNVLVLYPYLQLCPNLIEKYSLPF